MKMNKKYFIYLICSIGAMLLGIVPAQAILDAAGLENYRQHGQKLKELANKVLARDGYKVNLDEPIGAGSNGAVFKAIDKNKNLVAIKLSFSDSSQLQMTTCGSWKPYTPPISCYYYVGELELSRRFVSKEIYDQAKIDKKNNIKKYRPVYLGNGLPKIHALYRSLDLDKWQGKDWSIITVMDWVDGEDLETYTNKHKFNDSNVLDWSIKILEALKPLHDAGWYHRDLNAGNIMKRSDGSICVVDLGKAIDWYDWDHNTVSPWHNPELIANRDIDSDLKEMRALVLGEFCKSEQYQIKSHSLHTDMVNAFKNSKNCKELYEKLVSLKSKLIRFF